MTSLTVEYLKNYYPSLKDVSEEEFHTVLNKLKTDWIATAEKLKLVTRDDLLKKSYPLLFVNAVKPQQEGADTNDNKRKVEALQDSVVSKTVFLVTMTKGEGEEYSMELEFPTQPNMQTLHDRVSKECKQELGVPLFFLSNSGSYVHALHTGGLPDEMAVDDDGFVQLRIAFKTPPPAPEDKAEPKRRQIKGPADFSARLKEVWDQEEKQSPNIRAPCRWEKFGRIPCFFQDSAFRKLQAELSERVAASNDEDNRVCVVFAVPGAGKSRTIAECCTEGSLNFHREKVSDGVLKSLFGEVFRKKEEDFPSASYETVKRWLLPVAKNYLTDLMEEKGDSLDVLFFDEVQELMGHHILTSRDYDAVKSSVKVEIEDFCMPVFCHAIDELAAKESPPRVVLAGTKFFSPLKFNPGSAMKVFDEARFFGRFPKDWVIENLLDKYFDIGVVKQAPFKNDFEDIVAHICVNRRVVQYFLAGLRWRLLEYKEKLGAGDLVRLMKECSKKALGDWGKNFMHITSESCVKALAFCLYPEGFGGKRGVIQDSLHEIEGVLIDPEDIPQEVRDYANAGGLNISSVSSKKEVSAVEVPAGCLREFLLSRCKGRSSVHNSHNVEALQVAKNVGEKLKGHLFERLFAFELSTFGSQIGEVVCDELSKSGRQMKLDGRIFGRNWIMEPLIIDQWRDGSVLCVNEKSEHNGRRIVDVGFPLVNIANGKVEQWRVYCELKCRYTPGELWKMCEIYLDTIKAQLEKEEPKSIAVFVASKSFLSAKVQSDAATGKVKAYVESHELYRDRFFVFDEESLQGSLSNFLLLSDEKHFKVAPVTSKLPDGSVYGSDSQNTTM